MNKKANGIAIFLGGVLLVIAVLWIVSLAQRECSRDSHCGSDYYCGSDNKCHQMKIVEKTFVDRTYQGRTSNVIIIALAILIGAIIIRGRKHKAQPNDSPQNYSGHSEFIDGHIK